MERNEIFESMPIRKAYFKMALPVVFGMVVSLVYNMVDTWFIAQTQNTGLVAGVSLCAPLFTLMVAFGDIFGLGGSSLIARLFGQKNHEAVHKVSSFCFFGSLLFGVAVAVLMLLFSSPVLHLLGAKEDTISYASSYYHWLVMGAPFIIFNIVPGNLLRNEGRATEAMIGSILGAVINIILDPVFIFLLHMGAGGAALATVLSNLIGDIYLICVVLRKSEHLQMSWKNCRISGSELKDIIAIGIPASITNLMQSLAVLLTNRFLIAYGTDKVAALGIALKVNMITMLVMVGFAFGAQPLLGYNYGAGNKERLKKILRFDLMVELVLSCVFLLILLPLAPQVISIFMQQPEIISAGAAMLRFLMMTAPCMGVILVMTTLFQAEGKALPAFLLSISRQGVALILCLCILSYFFGYYGVILAQAASDILTLLLALLLYRSSANK